MPDYFQESLKHYGIKGMKWDVRRYQNKDGSLTPEGRRRLAQAEREHNTGKKKSETASEGTAKSGSTSSNASSPSENSSTSNKPSASSSKEPSASKIEKASEQLTKDASNAALSATAKVYEKWADQLQGYGDIKKSPVFDEYIKEYSSVMENAMNAYARQAESKNVEINGEVYEIQYKVVDGMAELEYKKVPNIQNDNEKKELKHHGILGMKWGVRRYQREDGTRTAAGKAREAAQRGNSDYEEVRALVSRGSKNLSTEELQKITKRLNLEKQYKDMNPSDFDKGLAFIKKITAAGTTVASLYALSKTPLGQDLLTMLKKKAS